MMMATWPSSYHNQHHAHDKDLDDDHDHHNDEDSGDDHAERDQNDDDFFCISLAKNICVVDNKKNLCFCPKTAESRKSSRFVSDTMSFYAYKKIVPVSVSVSNVNKMC